MLSSGLPAKAFSWCCFASVLLLSLAAVHDMPSVFFLVSLLWEFLIWCRECQMGCVRVHDLGFVNMGSVFYFGLFAVVCSSRDCGALCIVTS